MLIAMPGFSLIFFRQASSLPAVPNSFEGAWEAHVNTGPRLTGALTLTDSKNGLMAEIGGFTATCKRQGSQIEASFGDGQGRFRGRVGSGGAIEAFWIQPSGNMLGSPFATPFVLSRRSAHVWRGDIKPLNDDANFFLVVHREPNGDLRSYLRNPEGNFGRFMSDMSLSIDGDQVKLIRLRDKLVTAQGIFNRQNQTLALYFPWTSCSFDFTRVSQNNLSEFLPRPKQESAYRYAPPQDRNDGWPVGDAAREGLSPAKIETFVQSILDAPDDSIHSLNIHDVLLARHGKLVMEEYFHGFSPEKPHDLRSASKSLTSIMAGIAMDESPRLRLDSSVVEILRHRETIHVSDPRKLRITVQNLLTMSAGLDCDDDNSSSSGNEDTMQEQTIDKDYYHFTLNLPMAFEPGAKAVYGSALPNLLGGVIAEDRHAWLPEFFRDRLAKPLGIENYAINLSPDGEAYAGGGMRLRPRDFLKFGQLMLNGGTWRGERILSHAFVSDSTRKHYDLEGIQYGYLWWVTEYPFHGRNLRAFFAGGNGGQLVMVVPDIDLVFGCNAGNYSDAVFFNIQREWFPKYILPMIQNPGVRK